MSWDANLWTVTQFTTCPDCGHALEPPREQRGEAGYVTEVTVCGAAMLHIDLPAKLFGGEPDAWEEYAPSALYGLSPVREESVRRAWESQRRAVEERARREAEWQRTQEQCALTAGRDGEETDPDYDWAERPEGFPASSPADPF